MKNLLLAASLFLSACAPAMAQPICNTRDVIVQALDNLAHNRAGYGLDENGNLMEVWENSAGQWVLVVTSPKGVSCVIITGEMWVNGNLKPRPRPF